MEELIRNSPAEVVRRHPESTLDDAIDLLVMKEWRVVFERDTTGRIACIATHLPSGYICSVLGDSSVQCKRGLLDLFFDGMEGK